MWSSGRVSLILYCFLSLREINKSFKIKWTSLSDLSLSRSIRMRINGVYITREETTEIFFSDGKLLKILPKLYISNLIVFTLSVAFQVYAFLKFILIEFINTSFAIFRQIAVAVLEDQKTITIFVLAFILIPSFFLITGILQLFAKRNRNGILYVVTIISS